MCVPGFYFAPTIFSKPVTRTAIKRRRIYAFAADRMLEAKTPSAHRFWKGVMDCCVETKTDWVPRSTEEIDQIIRGLP